MIVALFVVSAKFILTDWLLKQQAHYSKHTTSYMYINMN